MGEAKNPSLLPIPETTCPTCGTRLNTATTIDDGRPASRDDVLLCVGCTQLLWLNPDLTLRLVTPDEYMALPLETRRVIIMARSAHAKMKGMSQ